MGRIHRSAVRVLIRAGFAVRNPVLEISQAEGRASNSMTMSSLNVYQPRSACDARHQNSHAWSSLVLWHNAWNTPMRPPPKRVLPTAEIRRPMNASLLLMSVLAILAVQPAPAQTFTVVHNFTGGTDGATPVGTLTVDGQGALYGTTIAGGANGLGTVFRLAHLGDTRQFYVLYAFNGLNNLDDGISPFAGVVIG